MDFEDFRKAFVEEVKADAAASGLGSVASFVKTASSYMLNADVFPDAITPAYFEGEGKRNRKVRIDGYIWDLGDNTMNVFIADYDAIERTPPMTKTLAQTFFNKISYFVEEAYGTELPAEIEPSTPAADLVDELKTNKEQFSKFRFVILSTRDMGERSIKFNVGKCEEIPVEYQIWDISRIYRVCCSNLGRQNIEIDFKKYTSPGIPCIEATGMVQNEFKSYLCIIPGSVLAQIYDDVGSQLLEGNVRSFLSTKVAVNKKIRATILQEPNKFFAYNNGVSATAMNLKFEKNSLGCFITYCEDFQIINGGQTTASLSNARRKDYADLSDIFVQMKLTEIDSGTEQREELIRNISKSSNSQNKVSDADFFSTHPFHVRMEQISRQLFAPAVNGQQFETHWFYERVRGQYFQMQMAMSKSEKEKFCAQNPKEQLVTKTDFAKARNSWELLPQFVSKGAQTNFMKFADIVSAGWEANPDTYNEKYFKETMAIIKLFKELEILVTNQSWYQQGYRANIVTYSIAIFRYLLKKNIPDKTLDLLAIWNKQQIPQPVLDEFSKIAMFVNECIVDPSRETANVTQWCKRDTCWTGMQKSADEESNLLVAENIDAFLISKDDDRHESRIERNKQHTFSDVEAQSTVINLKAAFWCQLEEFILAHRIGSPEMRKALWPAKRIPNKIPNPYQSKRLLELWDLARAEGFKPTADKEGQF